MIFLRMNLSPIMILMAFVAFAILAGALWLTDYMARKGIK